jgi:hypothetical protein
MKSSSTPIAGHFRTLSSLPDRRELAGLLGDLTVAWSHAERVSFFAFWAASGMTQTKAFDVYESLSGPKARMYITLDLLEQDKLDHPSIPALKAKMAEMVDSGRQRNAIVHKTWVVDDQRNLFLIDTRMPKRGAEAEAINEGILLALIKKIHAACDGYIELLMIIYPDVFVNKQIITE